MALSGGCLFDTELLLLSPLNLIALQMIQADLVGILTRGKNINATLQTGTEPCQERIVVSKCTEITTR